MASTQHLLLLLRGGYTTGRLQDEVWQCGIRFRVSNTAPDPIGDLPTDVDVANFPINRTETNWTITGNWTIDLPMGAQFSPDDWLNDQVAPAANTLFAANRFGQALRLFRLDVAPINEFGSYIPAPPFASGTPCSLVWTSSIPAGTGTTCSPPQCAVVASLRTAQVGRAGRGRIYLPMIPSGSWLDSTGLLTPTNRGNYSAAVAAFLQAVTIDDTGTGGPAVTPIVTGSGYQKYATINAVRVGDVVDTQQRRRRQISEQFSTTPV